MRWRFPASIAVLCLAASAWADDLNIPIGVTKVSRDVYDLHMTIFYVCVAIAVVVFGFMFWSMLVHRKSLGAKPATFHHNTTVEIVWTIIPFVILIAMAVPATKTLIEQYDTSREDIAIEARGYQWKWQYKYLDANRQSQLEFFSNLSTPQDEIHNLAPKGEHYLREVDNPLVIPIKKKVRFLITGNDVIHAWWVPEFGVKRDAVPGVLNEVWAIVDEPGVYRGQCTELCGKDHGFMPIVVNAVPQAEFDAWYAKKAADFQKIKQCVNQEWTADSLYKKGEEVYGAFCVSCHQAGGTGLPPAFPALKGSKTVLGPKEDHLKTVIYGRAGTAMQAFSAQLDPCSLAAVVQYERHAWGNNTPDLTKPEDVIALSGK